MTSALLCGGLGSRLRSVVGDRPKVLAPVGGRPLLDYQLRRLAGVGVTRVALSAGYLAGQIVEYVGDGSRWGLEVTVVVEEVQLGTGGALALAARTLDLAEPFLALNGDALTTISIADLWSAHQTNRVLHADVHPAATIAVVKTADPSRFGTVTFDELVSHDRHAGAADSAGPLVTGFREKATATNPPASASSWINAGVYVVEPRALEAVPHGQPVSLERDLFPTWIGRLFAFAAPQASLLDIGTPDDYARALEWINKEGWTAE